jgi:predicted acetyltransferase/DNA-binding MarR family transcriptional regulator
MYRVFSAFRSELSRFIHENQHLVKAAGFTPQQFSLLVLLGAAGEHGVSIGEAAGRLHTAHNSVVGLSQRAEATGLLRRVSQGGRRQGTRLFLTEEGARRLDEITAHLITELAEERLSLIETLSRWNTVLTAQGLLAAPGGQLPAGRPGHTLRRAGPDDRPVVWRLLQLYLDELSVPLDIALNGDGQYDYPAFDEYWRSPAHTAHLFHVGPRPAGFALVRRRDAAPGRPGQHVLDEFCVLRAYRGRGLSAVLAGEVLRARPGPWSVAHLPQNAYARHFWEHVLPRHAVHPPQLRPDEHRPGVWHFEFEVPPGPAPGIA